MIFLHHEPKFLSEDDAKRREHLLGVARRMITQREDGYAFLHNRVKTALRDRNVDLSTLTKQSWCNIMAMLWEGMNEHFEKEIDEIIVLEMTDGNMISAPDDSEEHYKRDEGKIG